jgi:hypothetical protein
VQIAPNTGEAIMTVKTHILRILDRNQLQDVADHGADAGFPGFCYYTDTERFYRKHRAEINGMVESLADDLGESAIGMVRGFRCIGTDYSESEVAQTMYGRKIDPVIANGLAWFALEETARQLTDN